MSLICVSGHRKCCMRIEKKEDGFAYGAIFIGMPEMEASRIQLYDTINNLTQAK